ncbi:MAG TPA: hypothetical protein VGI67_00450 [Thermoleophilaceae bacterium]
MLLVAAATVHAFVNLPANGSRVDNDPAAGIDPAKDAGALGAAGGSLLAGAPAVPWTIFEHQTSGAQQVFVRAFKNPAWVTQGVGTVNGASSASPTFSGSLNFDQGKEAEAPSIDFAGAGRTVPWTTWYEDSTAPFGHKEIFASRFDQTTGKWVFAGQGRPVTGGPPSLNIDVTKDAENPQVFGGAAVAGNNPGPWVVWQEQGPTKDQIFVVKPIGPGTLVCPPGTKPTGGVPVGGFCWQQVGVERSPLGSPVEPSLNVDPSREGIEPDITFTGPSDTVPWVVWYEVGGGGAFGVKNERVFAAKAVNTGAPAGTVDGGFHWEAVGKGTSAPQVLDTSVSGAGPCLTSKTTENLCTLNHKSAADAEDPSVAAGTMSAGQPTVPWVVWSEQVKKTFRIFAARLAGGTHFQIINGGKPLSTGKRSAVLPDIAFAKLTPYVTWHQTVGHTVRLFVGHFVNAANPRFVLDSPGGLARSKAGVKLGAVSPISSDCTANPFNADGTACQGGAPGIPFFLFNDGAKGKRKIFAAQDTGTVHKKHGHKKKHGH